MIIFNDFKTITIQIAQTFAKSNSSVLLAPIVFIQFWIFTPQFYSQISWWLNFDANFVHKIICLFLKL